MAKQLVIIVTGANKGIGIECVKNLVGRVNSSYLFKEVGAESTKIYLGSRDVQRGEAALSKIKTAAGVEVKVAQLDVSSEASIQKFANEIKEAKETVHALINNAGVSPAVGGDGGTFDSATVEWVLKTNYDGVREMTNAFLPLMADNGRVVNLSSGLSRLSWITNSRLTERLRAARTVAVADELAQEFRDSVKNGTYSKLGWPARAYSVSKILLNALTRGQAAELKASHPNLLINWVEPGWVVTDMGGSSAPGTASEGADTPCLLAVDDIGGKSGEGWRSRKIVVW